MEMKNTWGPLNLSCYSRTSREYLHLQKVSTTIFSVAKFQSDLKGLGSRKIRTGKGSNASRMDSGVRKVLVHSGLSHSSFIGSLFGLETIGTTRSERRGTEAIQGILRRTDWQLSPSVVYP